MRVGRWVFFAGLAGVIIATALEGCGGGGTTSTGDVCAAAPLCTKAVAPTASEQATCTALANEATCGAQYRAMKECQTYRAQCTSSGSYSSSSTNTVCKDSISAYNTCRATNDAGVIDAGCKVRTCAQAAANCGEIDNGCGTPIQCGTCTNGQTCGGGGVNRCGCKCDPTWCGTLTACNTTVTCPTNCTAPQFCGGGGIANRCGCTPSGSLGPLTSTSLTTATVALEGGAQTSWSNATNARISDNNVASATMSAGTTTQYLVALSFNASVPDSATIAGITVQVERSATAGLATSDYAVQLVKNTQILTAGDNKAAVGVAWPSAEATATYGGPTDLWGTTWTTAEVNAGGFGVAFSATYTGVNGTESARVDSIRVVIHYTGVPCN